jgi:hypothetical protein
MDGTAAMRRPVSELEIRRSASERRNHGAATSTNVYRRIHFQYGRRGPRSFRATARGSRSDAPMRLRRKTSVAGVSSPTAILMKR